MALNCWEVTGCGREPGGNRVRDLGACPVATEKRLDGVHDGTGAGRCCWVVAGTLCEGEVQGSFVQKFARCESCTFYRRVREEQKGHFILSPTLLSRLRS